MTDVLKIYRVFVYIFYYTSFLFRIEGGEGGGVKWPTTEALHECPQKTCYATGMNNIIGQCCNFVIYIEMNL